MINLDWACVDSIQRHNFDLLAADVEANLLCKDVNQVFQVGEGFPPYAPELILSGASHDPVHNKIERQCGHDTPQYDTSVDFE